MPAYWVLSDGGDLLGTTWSACPELALAKARRFFRRRGLSLLTAGTEEFDRLIAAGVECERRSGGVPDSA